MRFFNRELRKSRIVMASLLVREFFGFFLLCIFVFSAHISLCAFAIHVCLLLYTFPSVSQSRGNRVLPEGTVLVLLLRLSACTVLVTAEASRPLCELNKWVFPPGFETPSPGGRFLCKFNPPPPPVTRLYSSTLVAPSGQGRAISGPREASSAHGLAVQDGDSSHSSSSPSLRTPIPIRALR